MTVTRDFLLALAIAAAPLSGCKHGAILGADAAPTANALASPGEKLVLWALPGFECPVRVAASLSDARSGRGLALAGDPSTRKPRTLVVRGVRDEGNLVVIEASQVNGTTTWLALQRGNKVKCLHRDVRALTAAQQMTGKELEFAPWRKECTRLRATGQAPEALLVDSDGGLRARVTAVVAGAADAENHAKGTAGSTLWLRLNDGLLDVRLDDAKSCFVDAADPNARPSKSVAALLAPGRCTQDVAEPRHVSCTSTIATWEGKGTATTLSLRRVWRTLGPLHFFDGAPVDGSSFARTVVAVSVNAAENEESSPLIVKMGPTVNAALASASGGTVRAGRETDTDVSYRVRIGIADVRLGELSRSQSTASSEYKERDDVRDNPKKERARIRAERARERANQAQQEYDRDSQRAEERKKAVYEECKRQASNISQQGLRGAASASCDVGNFAIDVTPSRDVLNDAKRERDEAETAYQNEPSTITVPIMRTHSYTKTSFSRAAGAVLTLELSPKDGAPRTVRIPVEYTWSDYQVAAEPQYGVEGHTPDPGPLNDARALLSPLAGRIAQTVAQRVKQAVYSAALADSQRAFLAAGNEKPKPGFERVGALAFETAGNRLARSALLGRANVAPGSVFALPTGAAVPAQGQCLLAVAAAGEGREDVALTLRSADGRFADLRGRPFAALEICPEDAGNIGVSIEGNAAVEARWGLYLTNH